jgi:hypothetical protein
MGGRENYAEEAAERLFSNEVSKARCPSIPAIVLDGSPWMRLHKATMKVGDGKSPMSRATIGALVASAASNHVICP